MTNPSGTATDGNVAAGIIWAVDHGADVISISLSAPVDNNVLQMGVDYATRRNVLVVAAAGNSGSDIPEFPAACRGVVAVGATDASGNRTRFSNYGPWVDVNAPGVGIVTTRANSAGFTTGSGTSAATALVSGVAVLLRAAYPHQPGRHRRPAPPLSPRARAGRRRGDRRLRSGGRRRRAPASTPATGNRAFRIPHGRRPGEGRCVRRSRVLG